MSIATSIDLLAAIVDAGSWFELRPRLGLGMRTGFARIDGWSVGVIASDPRADDGRIDAAACEKVGPAADAVRLVQRARRDARRLGRPGP